jgi:XTP/dITP diphosphohydrolase
VRASADMTDTIQLVCATMNPDKLAEISAMLDGVADLLPRPDSVGEIPETALTFVGNARLKAHAIAQATGMASLGDDSGLEVDALDGAPGVHSVDYAGPQRSYRDNCLRLLADMQGKKDRRARLRTVMVVAWPDGREVIAEGVCEGFITSFEVGEQGFGYDSVFIPEVEPGILKDSRQHRTFAEMSMAEKNLISHRSKALGNLLEMLR